jgi:hypothetical protein
VPAAGVVVVDAVEAAAPLSAAGAVVLAASVELSLEFEGSAGLTLHVAKPAFTLGSISCNYTSPAAPVQSGNSTHFLGL